MGVLLDALKSENRLSPPATFATPATLTPSLPEKSQLSQESQGANAKIDIHRKQPQVVDAIDDAGAFDERAAIAEFDGKLPRAHAETLAALQTMPRPASVTEKQMAEIIDLTARRLDAALRKRITP